MLLGSLANLFHPGKPAVFKPSKFSDVTGKPWTISSRSLVIEKRRPQPAVLTPAAVLQANRAVPIACSIEDHCRQLIMQQQLEGLDADTFYVIDLGEVQKLKQAWDARCRPGHECCDSCD